MNVDNGEIIRRLQLIDPNAGAAFRKLCTQARICSVCCQSWDETDGLCACTIPAVSR